MSDTRLSQLSCEACRADAVPASEAEREAFLREIPDWRVESVDGVDRLTREFTFPDFAEALSLTVRIGDLAEEVGHHPLLITEWGKCTVSWWSHEMGGLHRNDFILAARTDELAKA